MRFEWSEAQRTRPDVTCTAAVFSLAVFLFACSDKKVEEGAHVEKHTPDTVQISSEMAKSAKLSVARASLRSFETAIEAPAEVQFAPSHYAHVASTAAGRLTKVSVTVGDDVRKGQTLASLESNSAVGANEAAVSAKAARAAAKAELERQQTLQREEIGAKKDLEEAERAFAAAQAAVNAAREKQQVLGSTGGSRIQLKSPIAGIVLERHAVQGEIVRPEQTLFVVGNAQKVYIIAQAYADDQAALEEKLVAEFVPRGGEPEQSYRGALDYVAPALDAKSRTLTLRMTYDNQEGLLRPGAFGTLKVRTRDGSARASKRLAIRAEAVTEVRGDDVVFVPLSKRGQYGMRSVKLGPREGEFVALQKGLSEGDRYVERGVFWLKSELLRGAISEEH